MKFLINLQKSHKPTNQPANYPTNNTIITANQKITHSVQQLACFLACITSKIGKKEF